MSSRSSSMGEERETASQPRGWDTSRRKLAQFIGVVAGNVGNLSFESQVDSGLGTSFDWDPWIRFMMPEFAVIMTADRRTSVRWPTGIIVSETGRVIPIDKGNCHPSDATLLLSGARMSELTVLIEALEPAIRGVVDGNRVASALQTVKQLQRICRIGP